MIVGTKFQLKLNVLKFQTTFSQKGYFQSKIEEVNTTIEFYIFSLDLVTNFILN